MLVRPSSAQPTGSMMRRDVPSHDAGKTKKMTATGERARRMEQKIERLQTAHEKQGSIGPRQQLSSSHGTSSSEDKETDTAPAATSPLKMRPQSAMAVLSLSPSKIEEEVVNKSHFLRNLKQRTTVPTSGSSRHPLTNRLATPTGTSGAVDSSSGDSQSHQASVSVVGTAALEATASASWAHALGLDFSGEHLSLKDGGTDAAEPLQVTLQRQMDRDVREAAKARHRRWLAAGGSKAVAMSQNADIGDEKEEYCDRLEIHSRVLRSLADKLQINLGPLIATIAGDLVLAHHHYRELLEQTTEFEKVKDQFETQYHTKITEVRQTVLREMKNFTSTSVNKDAAAEQLTQLSNELEQKLLEARVTTESQAKKIEEQGSLIKQLSREINVKRLMLKEVQTKTNDVITENKYLRQICAHNDDLLKEIEIRKETAALAQEANDGVQKSLRGELANLQSALHDRDRYLSQLKGTVSSQLEEISLLRQCQVDTEASLAQLRNERDTLKVSHTPRPDSLEAVTWLRTQSLGDQLPPPSVSTDEEASATGHGKTPSKKGGGAAVKKISTERVQDVLLAQAKETDRELKLFKSRIHLQGRVADYLSDDDLERLTRSGGFHKPSSECVFAEGNHDKVPVHLRWAGPIVVRVMPIEELLALVQYMMEERQSMAAATRLPKSFDEFYHYYFSSRCGVGLPAVEAAMSFEHSLRVHCWCPQVDVFRQLAEGKVPEDLFLKGIQFVHGAFTVFRSLLPLKSGLSMERKRKRFVKRKIFFDALGKYAPWLTEGDLLRLRAVMYEEVLSRFGDGIAKGMKEDIPLEALMESRDNDEDAALLVAGTSFEPVSHHSPMATALFRCFVYDYMASLNDFVQEIVRSWKLANGMSAPGSPVSTGSGGGKGGLRRGSSFHGPPAPLAPSAAGAFSATMLKSGIPSVDVVVDQSFLLGALQQCELDRTPEQCSQFLETIFGADFEEPSAEVSLEHILNCLRSFYFGRTFEEPLAATAVAVGGKEKRRDASPTGGQAPAPLDQAKLAEASRKVLGQARIKRPSSTAATVSVTTSGSPPRTRPS